jgi:hypothetical protein
MARGRPYIHKPELKESSSTILMRLIPAYHLGQLS